MSKKRKIALVCIIAIITVTIGILICFSVGEKAQGSQAATTGTTEVLDENGNPISGLYRDSDGNVVGSDGQIIESDGSYDYTKTESDDTGIIETDESIPNSFFFTGTADISQIKDKMNLGDRRISTVSFSRIDFGEERYGSTSKMAYIKVDMSQEELLSRIIQSNIIAFGKDALSDEENGIMYRIETADRYYVVIMDKNNSTKIMCVVVGGNGDYSENYIIDNDSLAGATLVDINQNNEQYEKDFPSE